MKQVARILWFYFFVMGMQSNAQTTTIDAGISYRLDTLRPQVTKRFEEKLDKIVKSKFVNLNEQVYIDDFLINKQEALAYSLAVFKIKFPDYRNPEPLKIGIGEDKTRKLWFIYITPPFVTYGGELFMIVVKNNCRIIYFEKTK